MTRSQTRADPAPVFTPAPSGIRQRNAVRVRDNNEVPPIAHEYLRSSVQPVDTLQGGFIEPRFGHDFNHIQVNSDSVSQQSSRYLNNKVDAAQHFTAFGTNAATPAMIGIGPSNNCQRISTASSTRENRLEQEADAVAVKGFAAPANDRGVREFIGNSLGFDFSDVRIHRDSTKIASQGAYAVAEGADIYFAPGFYRPDLTLGRALFAHELTHVAQQTAAPRRPAPGSFRQAIGQLGEIHSSAQLEERAKTIKDSQTELTSAPLGMQQRCVAGCARCSREEDSGAATTQSPPTTATLPATPPTPLPTHSVGPAPAIAGNKIVRLSWTVDDGPTPFTPGMAAAVAPRAATWFIMSNQLGTGTARSGAIAQLVTRQTAGDEIAIHSMHPTIAHSAWFPINLGTAVPKGYTTTAAAMTDLTTFTGELRTAGLKVHFGRMPGGELSEVKKYVEDQGGSPTNSGAIARALLSGTTPPVPAPATVTADVALVMSTLSTLKLHLWGGSASGPEVTSNTWEAESSGVSQRTDDVVRRFTGVVDNLASGARLTPGSFVILAHDTTEADVKKADANIKAMETYATGKGVRVEYYRMADLFQILRGTPP